MFTHPAIHAVAARSMMFLSAVALTTCTSPVMNGAPDDARLSLQLDHKTLQVGDSMPVYAVLKLVTEESAGSGWKIEFLLSSGSISATNAPIAKLTTDSLGAARIMIRTPGFPGSIIVRAQAREAVATDTITVEAKPDTSGTT
ncbi:MAG: hypothetical protein ABI877_14625 [Gemmatimonadaceae bacterium]